MNNDFKKNTTGTMVRIMRAHRQNCEKRMKEFGVHHSQHRMLMYIYRCGNTPPTQVQIAQFFSVSAAAVAVTVRKLEQGGYITRSARVDDLRNNEVRITQKGIDVALASNEEFDKSDELMFSGFSDDEMHSLRGYLGRMLENLERGIE